MHIRPFVILPFLVLMAAVVLVPASASATETGVAPFERLLAAGTGPDGTEFLGTLRTQRFGAEAGQLLAVRTLTGQVTRTTGSTLVPLETVDEVPVRIPVSETSATCERLKLGLDPISFGCRGLVVAVDPIQIAAADLAADGRAPEALLCPVAEALARGPT